MNLILFQANLTICDPYGRECYENATKTAESHCKFPVPCQGYYADFRASQFMGNSIITNKNPEFQRILYDYERYKGKMTGKYEGYSSIDNLAKVEDITGTTKICQQKCNFLIKAAFYVTLCHLYPFLDFGLHLVTFQ